MSRISLTLTLTSLAGIVFQPWLSYFELKGRVAARVGVEGGGGAGSEVAVEVGSGVAMAAVCIQICCDPPSLSLSLSPHQASRPGHTALETEQLGHAYNGLAFYQLTNTGNKKL